MLCTAFLKETAACGTLQLPEDSGRQGGIKTRLRALAQVAAERRCWTITQHLMRLDVIAVNFFHTPSHSTHLQPLSRRERNRWTRHQAQPLRQAWPWCSSWRCTAWRCIQVQQCSTVRLQGGRGHHSCRLIAHCAAPALCGRRHGSLLFRLTKSRSLSEGVQVPFSYRQCVDSTARAQRRPSTGDGCVGRAAFEQHPPQTALSRSILAALNCPKFPRSIRVEKRLQSRRGSGQAGPPGPVSRNKSMDRKPEASAFHSQLLQARRLCPMAPGVLLHDPSSSAEFYSP